jgi:hypothetical protein
VSRCRRRRRAQCEAANPIRRRGATPAPVPAARWRPLSLGTPSGTRARGRRRNLARPRSPHCISPHLPQRARGRDAESLAFRIASLASLSRWAWLDSWAGVRRIAVGIVLKQATKTRRAPRITRRPCVLVDERLVGVLVDDRIDDLISGCVNVHELEARLRQEGCQRRRTWNAGGARWWRRDWTDRTRNKNARTGATCGDRRDRDRTRKTPNATREDHRFISPHGSRQKAQQ